MSLGFRSWRFAGRSTPDINEASSKDITASLHRNVLSWGVWWGQEEKESIPLAAITHSAYSQTANSASCCGVTNLFRTASAPDVFEKTPKLAFSSITFATRKVSPSLSTFKDPVSPPSLSQHVTASSPQKITQTLGGLPFSEPTITMRVANSEADMYGHNPSTVAANGSRQEANSPADGLAARHREKRKVQLVQQGPGCTEADRGQHLMGGSLTDMSSPPSHRSFIHLEVPLRSASSIVFLDKSLSVSLVQLQGRRGVGRATLYRSTLSVRLGVSACHRSSRDSKAAKTNERRGTPRTAKSGHNKRNGRENGLGPPSKHRGCKVEQILLARSVNREAEDSETQCRGFSPGLMSYRGPGPSDTKAGRLERNADEAALLTLSNCRHTRLTCNIGPVDSAPWTERAESDETDKQQDNRCSIEPRAVHDLDDTCSKTKADALRDTKTLSLKEALELFRPDFISRSQGRVRRLEQRARGRRALYDSSTDLVQGHREDQGTLKRNCTTPDPISDNLFKPRERSISGREMQLRSRRLYNKLPEVTRKKEEEKKRAVSQTNRLRAEVFKKRLLDQVLQR